MTRARLPCSLHFPDLFLRTKVSIIQHIFFSRNHEFTNRPEVVLSSRRTFAPSIYCTPYTWKYRACYCFGKICRCCWVYGCACCIAVRLLAVSTTPLISRSDVAACQACHLQARRFIHVDPTWSAERRCRGESYWEKTSVPRIDGLDLARATYTFLWLWPVLQF